MTMTQQQFDETEKALNLSGLNPDLIGDILGILKKCVHGPCITPATPYSEIKGFTAAYKAALEERGSGIVCSDYEDEMMITYMDRDRVERVFDNVPAGGFLAGIPSVHTDASGLQQFTISLLPCNPDLTFVESAYKSPIDGEEIWGNFNILKNFDKVFK